MTDKIEVIVHDDELLRQLPNYATTGSAAVDLRASIPEPLVVKSGGVVTIPTGLSIHIGDPNLAGVILPRSGLGHNHGIILGNTIGLIDSDYQGEIKLSVWNRGPYEFLISPYDRIAQMMFVVIERPTWKVVKKFSPSERGSGGYGSTGVK